MYFTFNEPFAGGNTEDIRTMRAVAYAKMAGVAGEGPGMKRLATGVQQKVETGGATCMGRVGGDSRRWG